MHATGTKISIETSFGFQAAKSWIWGFLLSECLGLDYELRQTSEYPDRHVLTLPNGRRIFIRDDFFSRIPDESGWLSTTVAPDGIDFQTCPFHGARLPVIYGSAAYRIDPAGNIHCGLDLAGSAFFMLSRWEEYRKEKNGRFPASGALSVKAGFLQDPVVDHYAAFLAGMIRTAGIPLHYPLQKARLHLSCDVDHPRLWRSRADQIKTLASSVFRRFDIRETQYWLSWIAKHPGDPYDVFDEWMDLAEGHGLRWHFNFLGERPKRTDSYYRLDDPFIRDLMQRIRTRGHAIGFHPSREAVQDARRFESELSSLRQIAGVPVNTGRHHYLNTRIPDTWRRWEQAGMSWDSTLGYAEAEGFRCGTSRSFPLFDLEQNRALSVREKPLIAMDVTLALYRKYEPEEALVKLLDLWKKVDRHGGEFVLLWHNSSVNSYFWRPWGKTLTSFIRAVQPA